MKEKKSIKEKFFEVFSKGIDSASEIDRNARELEAAGKWQEAVEYLIKNNWKSEAGVICERNGDFARAGKLFLDEQKIEQAVKALVNSDDDDLLFEAYKKTQVEPYLEGFPSYYDKILILSKRSYIAAKYYADFQRPLEAGILYDASLSKMAVKYYEKYLKSEKSQNLAFKKINFLIVYRISQINVKKDRKKLEECLKKITNEEQAELWIKIGEIEKFEECFRDMSREKKLSFFKENIRFYNENLISPDFSFTRHSSQYQKDSAYASALQDLLISIINRLNIKFVR